LIGKTHPYRNIFDPNLFYLPERVEDRGRKRRGVDRMLGHKIKKHHLEGRERGQNVRAPRRQSLLPR
jgi:hypothetical protein